MKTKKEIIALKKSLERNMSLYGYNQNRSWAIRVLNWVLEEKEVTEIEVKE